MLISTLLLLLACGAPAGPPVRLEVVDVGAFAPRDQKVVFRATDALGQPADLERAVLEVRITERPADAAPGSGGSFCEGTAAVQPGDVDDGGTARVLVPFASVCRRAGPGLVGDITVTLESKGAPLTVSQIGSPSLQSPVTTVPEPTVPEPTVPEPAAEGLVIAPYPLALPVVGATLGKDPADPAAVVVHTAGCDIRVAEPHPIDGPITATSSHKLLESVGAVFTTTDVGSDRWALAYRIAATGSWSIQHGLRADGHTYVCRGDYPSPELQACGAALCTALAPTGGTAAPTHVISGAFVVHCTAGDLCVQATESLRVAHAPSCAMVGVAAQEGPCPEDRPRIGACTTPDGMQWVYYTGALSAAEAHAQCLMIKGEPVGM